MTDESLPEPTFSVLVTQLAAQALVELGEAPNPISGKPEVSLPRARFTIDLLALLREKTRDNLDDEEQKLLDGTLSRLKMRYAERVRD